MTQIIEMIFLTIAIVGFIIRTFYFALVQTYVWQIKEYRRDRFLVFFNTVEGKKIFLNKLVYIKIAIVGLTYLVTFYYSLLNKNSPNDTFQTFLSLIFAVFFGFWAGEGLRYIWYGIKHRWRRPKITFRSAVILFGTLTTVFGLILVSILLTRIFIIGLLMDIFLPIIIVFFCIFDLNTITLILQKIIASGKKQNKKNEKSYCYWDYR